MFLLILDKNPYKAAEYLIEHTNKTFVFKSLLELCQLICSAGISDVYKPIKQGKELQEWIKNNRAWVYSYFRFFYIWVTKNIKIKNETQVKINEILWDLYGSIVEVHRPQTAIFRYVKEYAEMTEYESNSELPIKTAINEYKRYVEWKEKQFNEKRIKKKEEKWQKIIEKDCEYEFHPQQDVCFCKLNAGYICWWENCPMINKKVQQKEV